MPCSRNRQQSAAKAGNALAVGTRPYLRGRVYGIKLPKFLSPNYSNYCNFCPPLKGTKSLPLETFHSLKISPKCVCGGRSPHPPLGAHSAPDPLAGLREGWKRERRGREGERKTPRTKKSDYGFVA